MLRWGLKIWILQKVQGSTIEARRTLLQTYRDELATRIGSLTETLDVLDAKIANYDTTSAPLKDAKK